MNKQVELVKARLAGKSHVYHKEEFRCYLWVELYQLHLKYMGEIEFLNFKERAQDVLFLRMLFYHNMQLRELFPSSTKRSDL